MEGAHDGHDALVRAFGIAERFTGSARLLVVTEEPIAQQMAGPAIRAWEVASVLAATHEVRLVTTAGCQVSQGPGFAVSHASGPSLRAATDWADVIVFQGFLLEGAPWLVDSTKILVAVPVLVLGLLWMANRAYVRVLFDTPSGQHLFAFSVASIVIGFFVINRMANLDTSR